MIEFNSEVICFNIFVVIRYPSDLHFIFAMDAIKTLVQDFFKLSSNDNFKVVIYKNLKKKDFKE